MGFWIFMLLVHLLIPITMICFGLLFLKTICYRPNAYFGYRTNMSVKNNQTWYFAHRYIGRLWFIIGIVIIPFTIIPMLLIIGKDTGTVGTIGTIICTAQLVCLIVPAILTDKALKRHFNRDGCPR